MSGLVLGPHKLNSTWERAKRETVIQESCGAARGRPAAGAGGAAWSGGEKRAAQAAHVPVSLCRRPGSLTRPPHTHPCPFPVADGLSASCSRPSAPRWGPRGSRSASPASLLHSAIQGRSGVVRYPLLETSGAPALQPPISPRAFAGSRARPRAARASASACATPSPARDLCPRSQGCFGPRDPVWVLLASGLSLPPAVCGLPAAPTRAPPFPRSASAPGLQGAALRGPPSAGCCLPVSRAPC